MLFGALWVISVDNGLPADNAPGAEYSAFDSARLEISLHQGRLQLDGHAASHSQERVLLQRAARDFPGARTSANFKPLGTAPDYWTRVSISVLEALTATQSANALLIDDKLRIRGVSNASWQEALPRLRQALPDFITLDIEMIIADDGISAGDLCQRAFVEYRSGAINFEESTTVLRSSAKLALDRAISLADACRGSAITITGHTDSSGPELWNRQLSLARANAVANYLVKGGIAGERLLTFGAGSSEPLASNASRYGRGLNRRIEIRFRQNP